MTISIRQQSTIAKGNSTAHAITMPSTPVSGNILVCLITGDKNTTSMVGQNGFTVRTSSLNVYAFIGVLTKISDGTESGAITAYLNGNARQHKAMIVELQGTGTIGYDNSLSAYNGGSVNSIASGNLTTGTDAAFAIALFGNDSAKSAITDPDPTPSWTNGYTTFAQEWDSTSGAPAFCASSKTLSGAGTESTTGSHDGVLDQMVIALISFTQTGGGGGGSKLLLQLMNN